MATRRGQGSSSTATKRIRKEINDLSRENLGALKLWPNESNILQWRALIPGPEGSAYEGGVFEVSITIPEEYPFTPPQLHFLTKVYHCNIAANGAICLDILKNNWSPALSLYKVILSLSSLLTDPNPSDPLVPTIAQELKRNKAKHDATARDWVKKYALPKEITPPEPTPQPQAQQQPQQRPRPLPRPRRDQGELSPIPQIVGTRRPPPGRGDDPADAIELGSDDDEIQVIGSSAGGGGERQAKRARVTNGGSGGGNGGGSGSGSGNGSGGRSGTGTGTSGDVIVIDD